MTNRLIELHDSRVLDLTDDGDHVLIAMSAYVHESEGRPGIDAGTGWTQPVRITVFEGRVVRRHQGDRLWIIDGVIRVGDETFDNMMPTDVLADGDVKLVFSGAEGVLDVVGAGIRVEVTGEAKHVEDFPRGG
jgi:hypothetical protein